MKNPPVIRMGEEMGATFLRRPMRRSTSWRIPTRRNMAAGQGKRTRPSSRAPSPISWAKRIDRGILRLSNSLHGASFFRSVRPATTAGQKIWPLDVQSTARLMGLIGPNHWTIRPNIYHSLSLSLNPSKREKGVGGGRTARGRSELAVVHGGSSREVLPGHGAPGEEAFPSLFLLLPCFRHRWFARREMRWDSGMQGVGKTTLVMRVLESLRASHPDLKVRGFYTRKRRSLCISLSVPLALFSGLRLGNCTCLRLN